MDSNLCRVCSSKGSRSIFDHKDALYIKLNYMSSTLNIKEGDGLPSLVCNLCENECQRAYQFVLKCEAADQMLRALRDTVDKLKTDVEKEEPVKQDELDSEGSFGHVTQDDVINIEAFKLIPSQDYLEYDGLAAESSRQMKPKKIKKVKSNSAINYFTDVKQGHLKCPLCDSTFEYRRNIINHVLTHCKNSLECPVCNKSSKNNQFLKNHIRKTHCETKVICECCGKVSSSKRALIAHIRTHTGEKPYRCSICPKTYSQQGPLLRHERIHKGIKLFACPLCDKAFADKSSLKAHSSKHSNERKYNCAICNKYFKDLSSLRVHKKRHNDNEKEYHCDRCGKILSTKGNLRSHVQICQKSGKCTICKKTVSNLDIHMRRHTGECPYKCELCPNAFTSYKGLTRHIDFQHKAEGRYKCTADGCDEGFRSKPMLEYHMLRFHIRKMPHLCGSCSRAFYRRSDLVRHSKLSHKDKPP